MAKKKNYKHDSLWMTPSYYEALEMAIKALEQEPKTIQEKQAESEKYDKAFDDGYKNGYAQARFDYEQEPKTGHWVAIDEEPHEDYECDKCRYTISTYTANIKPHTEYKYCPNCGCRMIEPQESEG